LSETIALYDKVRAMHRASTWSRPNAREHLTDVIYNQLAKITALTNCKAFRDAIRTCLNKLLALERTIFVSPSVDWDIATLSLKEQVDLRRFLRAQQHFLANAPRIADLLVDALDNIFVVIIRELSNLPDKASGPTFAVPLLSLVPNVGALADRIIGTLTIDVLRDAGLFTEVYENFYKNVCVASGVAPGTEIRKSLLTADQSKLPPAELIET